MKDIPIFTGCDGIATLILSQIPYRGEAFVLIRSVFTNAAACIRECESFCRAAGAEQVYFGGHADFDGFELYASIIEREAPSLPQTDAIAVPTSEFAWWAEIYNEKFKAIPAAKYCITPENPYIIKHHGEIIGIGQVGGNTIRSVAALQKGRGADCVCALARLCEGQPIRLLCAEQNLSAMRLYDRLGFSRGERKEVWYKKTLAI